MNNINNYILNHHRNTITEYNIYHYCRSEYTNYEVRDFMGARFISTKT